MITVRYHGKHPVQVFKCSNCNCVFSAEEKDYEIITKTVKVNDHYGWFRDVEYDTYKITCPDCNVTDSYDEISKPDSINYPYVRGTCWEDEEFY